MKSSSSPLSTTACPNSNELHAFSRATLNAAEMDRVDQHLRQCPECLDRLEEWDDESDVLIQTLTSLPSTPDDEPEFRSVHETLLMGGAPDDMADGETLSFNAVPRTSLEDFPSRLVGYQLLEMIGRGATGTVFRARHTKLDRIVAIKILNSRYVGHDPSAVGRFQQEMKAVGQLDHHHIVRATDAGESNGHHYLVMEFIDGIDTSRLLRLTGPLRVADACEIARQAAIALQFAHECQMVHRDVKPSNLLFGFDGCVRLSDLGLVRSDGRTEDSGAVEADDVPRGTADYMPPEQWTAFSSVDATADVYALGCTLYKLLTGRPVYGGQRGDYASKMQAHLSSPVPNVRDLRPEVPLGLQKIVTRMLSKRPDDRYGSASEVAERLAVYAQGARLEELGRRIASTPVDQLRQMTLEDSTVDPPSTDRRRIRTRRSMLAAAAAATVSLAMLRWGFSSHKSSQLQLGQWRPVRPGPDTTTFRGTTSTDFTLVAESRPQPSALPLEFATTDNTLFHFGQPVQGHFAMRVGLQMSDRFERVGVFFRYRPHKASERMVYPFYVVELVPGKAPSNCLLAWSRYRFTETDADVYHRDYLALAETPIPPPLADHPLTIELTLGRRGFPEVIYDDQPLDPASWHRSWEAKTLSRQTRDELRHWYLGQIGVFAGSAQGVISRLDLRYLDPSEIL